MRKRNRSERRAPLAARTQHAAKATQGRTTATRTPMSVRTLGVDIDSTLQDYLARRLGFKLGKFALQTRRVSVRLLDESGPRGKATRVCRIKILLDPTHDVVVEEKHEDLRAAIDGALDRAERNVRKALQKMRGLRRAARERT